MSGWTIIIFFFAAVSSAALLAYIRQAKKTGDRVLVAHGLILLIGLILASLGVAVLKLIHV
ncbi:MAG: hypothetical protein IKL01_01150 [Mailhella sp.]|nr:hypothetical protein [Mailhella sp.]